jgi:phospholipid-binding lipoprotein MlaA
MQARLAALLSLTAAVSGLSACATRPPASDTAASQEFEQTNDPLEPTNRFFYRFDNTLDKYTLKPIAQGYVAVIPAPVRTGLHNVLSNLSSPVLFGNDVLQAHPRYAGDTLSRFLINSTIGIGGVFDVAKGFGIKPHDTGFNITLAVWGVPSGPFLYLPILGPSSPRGVAGFAGDIALDPFTYVPHGYGLLTLNWARYGLGVIDTRASLLPDLDRIKANALDPYATIRSLYRQHTESEIEKFRHDRPETATPPSP